MQKQGVSATVKHFAGNDSEFDRHNSDSVIDERTLREIYLPAFEASVKQGHVGAIMDGYNVVNGQHMTQNGYLNNQIARTEWGFDGVIMSDWVATYDGVGAANGGLDLEMPVGDHMNAKTLLPAIQDGRVKASTIDEKVAHVLQTAIRFGWLDRTQMDLSISKYSEQNHAVALEAARENMVLLKNEGQLLPLDKAKIRSVLVGRSRRLSCGANWRWECAVNSFRNDQRPPGNERVSGPGQHCLLRSRRAQLGRPRR